MTGDFERFASLLNLPQSHVNIPVVGIHQIQSTIQFALNAKISSNFLNFITHLSFLVVPRITNDVLSVFIIKKQFQIPKLVRLADPNFKKSAEIDALISNEIFLSLLMVGQIEIAKPLLVLQKTKFGWILGGKYNFDSARGTQVCGISLNSLDEKLSKFWEIEEILRKKILTIKEQQAVEHYT